MNGSWRTWQTPVVSGELLTPENRMLLAPAVAGARRKTAFDLVLVEADGVLVSVDSRLPNVLLQGDRRRPAAGAWGYDGLAREVGFEDSRLDIVLSGDQGQLYLEAKSVTLVVKGTALFPDAPTERGRKHLAALVTAVRKGDRAAVAFVIQRADARECAPNEGADPLFCRGLREATRHGVEIYAYRCAVSRSEIEISSRVPVRL